MGHPSRYGPDWTVSSRSGGSDGGDCIHLAKVTDAVRERFARECGAPMRADTTHVARDEHGGWLELTASEARAWVQGAKAGDFDHLFNAPPAADPSGPGIPIEGWPEKHMLEAAYGLLCSAAPVFGDGSPHSAEWEQAFRKWRDAYHEALSEAASKHWSCSA